MTLDGRWQRLRDGVALTRTLLRARRWKLWAAALGVVSVGLALVPQLNVLNYFFAFAVSLLVGPAALHIGLGAGRLLRPSDGSPPPAPRVVGAAVLASLALALVPLVLISLNALRVRNCDMLGGLAFYAMGPLFGAAYATVLGVAAGALSARRSFGRVAYAVLVVLALALPLWRIYAEPPVHQYHPLVGFFSGAIYDEVIEIGWTFVVYRLTNLLEILALTTGLAVCRESASGRWRLPWRSGAPWPRVMWFGIAATAALVAAMSPATLGYRYDREAIEAALGGRLTTEHFELWYPGGTPYERVAPRVARECERDYADIVGVLGRAPTREPGHRVRVFIYPDSATKRALMGADRVYIAKPWLLEVHLGRVDVGADVIRHELVHALGSVCAPGPLHVPAIARIIPHMGLIEGLAEAIAWRGGRLTYHQASAAMRRLGIAPDMRKLMGPEGFWTTAARKAYVTSGSFLRALIERRGAEPVCRLYRDADFEAAYGVPVETLIADWEATLDDPVATPLDDEELQLARDAFDRPSVFGKVCALEVARWERAASRATARRDFDRAARLLGEVARFDAENPAKRQALGGALLRAGELDAADAAFATVEDDAHASRVLKLRARAARADVLWRQGDRREAARRYRELAPQPMAPSMRRLLTVKAEAAEGSEARALKLRSYLLLPILPGEADAIITGLAHDDAHDPLILYLLGWRRAGGGRSAEAARAFDGALSNGALPDALREAATISLGVARFIEGDPRGAKAAFERALAGARWEGARVNLRTWIARSDWAATHPSPTL